MSDAVVDMKDPRNAVIWRVHEIDQAARRGDAPAANELEYGLFVGLLRHLEQSAEVPEHLRSLLRLALRSTDLDFARGEAAYIED